MEAYAAKVKRQMIATIVLTVLFIAAVAVMNVCIDVRGGEHVRGMVAGYQAGFGVGILTVLLMGVVRCLMALRNEEKLRKLYIKDTDERTRLIHDKSGAMGMNIVMIGFAMGSVLAGFFDATVFYTLVAATYFVCTVRLGLKLYYRKRY